MGFFFYQMLNNLAHWWVDSMLKIQGKRELKTYCFSMVFENSKRLPALVIINPYPVVKHTTPAISAHAKGVGEISIQELQLSAKQHQT
jgi:hypothetical protein